MNLDKLREVDVDFRAFVRNRFPPDARPLHITECSTPPELETYLKRGGFSEVQVRAEGLFVQAWGHKRRETSRDH